MKPRLITFLIAILFLLTNCGNNKAATKETNSANNTTTENKESTPAETITSANVIVGEWEQQYTSFDKNGNYELEPEEKKASGTKLGFDWFKFNADGSCLRDKDVKFEGAYEIQEKGNTKKLVIEGGDNLRYTITQLTDQELILGADGAFIVFKKIE